MKYGLLLNDMREPNIENMTLLMVSDNKKDILEWYYSQEHGYWRDGIFNKFFKKYSPLEWYNPADVLDEFSDNYFGGIYEFEDDIDITHLIGKVVLWKRTKNDRC